MTAKKNQKTSKKIPKGDFGYFKSEKKRRLIITAILFAVPLFIFFTSWIYFKTRMTVWTVVAVVGCLPACKSMVGLIMIFKCRPMDSALYQKIRLFLPVLQCRFPCEEALGCQSLSGSQWHVLCRK